MVEFDIAKLEDTMLDFFRLGLRTSATKSTTRTQPTKKLEKQIKHFKHLLINRLSWWKITI